jgi:fibronectin-binding autotransporter adhesin
MTMSPQSLRQKFLQACNYNIFKTFSVMFALTLFPASLSANTLLVAAGPGEGQAPVVRLFIDTGQGTPQTINVQPYPSTFKGGVRVAVGDVNGDGVPDVITAPGPGFASLIGVFDGNTGKRLPGSIGNFLAFPFFQGGVYVAAGDVNGDGNDDIIVAPDAGMPPIVLVFDGKSGEILRSFFAYSSFFTGGVRVAAGDVNGDGKADIITGAGPGGGPHVKVFNGVDLGLLKSFFAFNANLAGGVYVAAGDVNGDGRADIVAGAGPGGGPNVSVFDGGSNQLLHSFFAFGPAFTGGVRVAAGDVNGDGKADIITGAGPGGGPHVIVFNSQNRNVLHSFFAYDPSFHGGVFVGGRTSSRQVRR